MSYFLRAPYVSFIDRFCRLLNSFRYNSQKLYAGKERPQEYEPGELIFAMPKVKKTYWMSSFLVQFLALLQDTCLKRMSGLRCLFPTSVGCVRNRQCKPNDNVHLSCDCCRTRLYAYVSVVQTYQNPRGSILVVKCF